MGKLGKFRVRDCTRRVKRIANPALKLEDVELERKAIDLKRRLKAPRGNRKGVRRPPQAKYNCGEQI